MNQLEELRKLQVKSHRITIPKNPREGEPVATLMFTPRSLEEMAKFSMALDPNTPQEDSMNDIIEVLASCLNCDVKEINKLSSEHLADLMDYFMEFHGNKREDVSKTDKLKDFMAQKQTNKVPKSSEIRDIQ